MALVPGVRLSARFGTHICRVYKCGTGNRNSFSYLPTSSVGGIKLQQCRGFTDKKELDQDRSKDESSLRSEAESELSSTTSPLIKELLGVGSQERLLEFSEQINLSSKDDSSSQNEVSSQNELPITVGEFLKSITSLCKTVGPVPNKFGMNVSVAISLLKINISIRGEGRTSKY